MMFFMLVNSDDPGDVLLTRLYDDHHDEWVKFIEFKFQDLRNISAEDILNDVFVRLIDRVDTLLKLTENQCITYITKSLINRCREVWRKKAPVVVSMEAVGPIEEKGTDPYAIYEKAALENRCKEVLNGLPERDRELLISWYILEVPKPDLERAYNLKPGSLRKQLSRSRGLLRERAREVLQNEFEIYK